jgi:DNA-binding response OmpR family regulator
MRPRIAVVNDDTEFIGLMRDLLSEEQYRVSTHLTADSAYRDLVAERPDLIVLDIRMETPEAGWQLLELLRLNPATAHTPAIVCSADAPFLRAKQDHLRQQGYDTLEKPFDLDTLLAKIAAALARAREG